MTDTPDSHGTTMVERGLDRFMPRWFQVGLVQAIILAIAGTLIHIPFHSIAPGETRNVIDEISIEGTKTYESEGAFLLTTASVSTAPLTVWDGIAVWISPGHATIPRPFLVPPGATDEDVDVQNRHDIEASKITAAVAAFRALGHEVPIRAGAAVVTIIADTPAEEVLREGDRIVAVNGKRAEDARAVSDAIGRADPGDELSMDIIRRGRERTVLLRTAEVDGRAFVGITMGPAYDFPSDVVIDSGEIVGPSAGLAFALSIADVIVKEDLTRGLTIGITGTIELDERGRGVVGPIGAVSEKVRGAFRDGATVFLVPEQEAADAKEVAPPGMDVIGVRTLTGAIRALRDLDRR